MFQSDVPSQLHARKVFALFSDGRPNGDAFVSFATEEDCKEALARHRTKLQDRYIDVFPAMKVQCSIFVAFFSLCTPWLLHPARSCACGVPLAVAADPAHAISCGNCYNSAHPFRARTHSAFTRLVVSAPVVTPFPFGQLPCSRCSALCSLCTPLCVYSLARPMLARDGVCFYVLCRLSFICMLAGRA